jgi:hypothetical protein
MANKLAERSPIKSETYKVIFDLLKRNSEIWVQRSEVVAFYSKGKEVQATKEVTNKYKGRGDKIKIVSVKYQ